METVGDRIRQQREAKGYSQQKLADLLGVTKAAVSHWENGRSANVKNMTMLKLEEVLGCTQEYLLRGPSSRGSPGKSPGGARGAGSGNQPT
jgi:transcriptional regulator with XRE-family HTH domain